LAYPMIQARNYTRGPRRGPVDVVVIHTMESPEGADTAENVARWFAGSTAPKASAHYCVDNNSVVQGVREEDIAWAAPGCNHNGIQVEHAGRAAQGKAGWKDTYTVAMLYLSAKLVEGICRRHKIPVRWLSVMDVKEGRRGITSHNNVSLAFRKSNHTDPGPDFPVEDYLKLVRSFVPKPLPKPVPKLVAPKPVARIDVEAGTVILKGQNPDSPLVQARLRRLLERFGEIVIRKAQ
jgi:N-acetyl-anhydromuramyl-L-alanine amidase AmpD